MLPNREGLFHAYPFDIGVAETGPNNLATCTIQFQLFEELVTGQWQDCLSENLDITGYFYLEKKDGALNTVTIDALKAALGWDGRDPFWLQDTDLREQPVQVRLGWEEYQGQQRIKVQFLNPYGSMPGGVSKADDSARRSLNNRLGSKLRALAGGTPANAPKPAGKPKPPARKPAPPAPKPAPPKAPTATAEAPEPATMDEAWEAFCAAYDKAGPGGSPEDRERQWFAILGDLFPGKQPDELGPADWGIMITEGPDKIIPF